MEFISKKKRDFRKGLKNLKIKDKENAKKEILQALGLSSNVSFWRYKKGISKNGKEKYLEEEKWQIIEKIFAKYGVKPKDVWNEK